MASNVNTLSIDVNGLWMAIHAKCHALLNDVAEKVIKEFGEYIVAAGAGMGDWRRDAANEFKIISDEMTNYVLEMQLGVRDSLESDARSDDYYAVRVMVALFGNHPPGGGFYTKPGTETYHDHITDKRTSDAQGVYRLPEGFNWDDPGADKMLENSMKRIETYFEDGLQRVLSDINFYDYVYVN